MERRRFTGFCATGVALAAALAGCSSGATEGAAGGPVTIDYWLWQDDSTDPTWTELAEDFNASQDDVQVELTTIPLDQYQDRLLTAAASGTAPCVARSKDWWLGQLAPQGVIADVTSYVDEWEGKDDVIGSLWDTGRLPGADAVYMVPHQYVTLWLYYNKATFAEAGLEPPTTQQEFLDVAARLTDPAAGKYAFDVRGGAGGQDQWMAWMFAGGADVVDDNGDVVINDATAEKVNADYLSIYTEIGATPPGSNTADFKAVQANFASGTTAMAIHHPGSLLAMREALGDDLGVVPIPVGDGVEPATLTSMSGNVILEDCEDKDAAWQWIAFLTSGEPMKKISTSVQGQLPVLESVATSAPYSEDPDLQVALEAARTAKAWPALPGVAQLSAKDWQTEIQTAFEGDRSSQEMLDNLAALLKD
jgi:multiple sugar transport system substrate-binding protein